MWVFADTNDIAFSPAGIAVITALLGTVAGCVVVIFKLFLVSKDAMIAELREQRDSLKKVADRAVASLEAEAERQQLTRGETPIPRLKPVAPEHNSPTSERQQQAADLGTLQAREVAAKLALVKQEPLEPRPEPKPVRVVIVPDEPVPVVVVPEPARDTPDERRPP